MTAYSKTNLGEFTSKSNDEIHALDRIQAKVLEKIDLMGSQWQYHAGLLLTRISLSRLLFLDKIYQEIIDSPGVILELGVQWGATTSTLLNLRGIYEPYNYSRKIIGFDTFEGLSGVDGITDPFSQKGDYRTNIDNYSDSLEEILLLHERLSPLSHIQKFELVKGDVRETLPNWLHRNPHAVASLIYFDMDIYSPTKTAIELLLPRLHKNSILVFDEFNCEKFPGETKAVLEVLDINRLSLRRCPSQPYCAWTRLE
jgi:hypothetical protein